MNVCKVCKHPEKNAIDAALVRGTPYRKVAAQFSGVSGAAIQRHKRHIPGTLVEASNAERVSEATNLLTKVDVLIRESEAIADAAKKEKDPPAATSALREARSCLELLGRVRGELHNGASVKVGIAVAVQSRQPAMDESDLELAIARELWALTEGSQGQGCECWSCAPGRPECSTNT